MNETTPLSDIKFLLGGAAPNYSEDQINLCWRLSKSEVEAYTLRSLDDDSDLFFLCERITVLKLNRLNSEGLASQSYSGVSESYVDGYGADVMRVLNRKRKIRTV